MKANKSVSAAGSYRHHGILCAVLLLVILGALFWRSFLPDYVHFANDGPLGQQNTQWCQLPQGITDVWVDLNSVGFNGGAFPPDITTLIRWMLHAVGFAKFYAPIAQFILGLGAWTFFRQLKLTPLAATLGALATALVSLFFSDSCWGTATHQIAFGMDYLALALIVSNSAATPWFLRWTRLALAGLAVGVNIMEAADIGAIFSVFVAAFTLYHSLVEDEPRPVLKKIGRGVGRIIIIAAFAAFIATQVISALVSTQIQGIVGTGQSEEARAAHWDYATQWSLPKTEMLGIIVPGLFGYRMDTLGGGNYWGAVGRDPRWDLYLADGGQGSPPQGFLRFSGTGNYAGVLVILVAFWSIAQLLRRQNSVFSVTHRQFLWFWTVVLVLSLLLAFGRFAPFYHLIYSLPYFSTIRNPIKFLFVLTWALVVIFAYGIHGLSRHYIEIPAAVSASPLAQFKTWWAKTRSFDRNWISVCIVFVIGSLLAWLIYALQEPKLAAYLQTVGFSDGNMASQIAAFSVHQVGWLVLFLALEVALLALILSGAFARNQTNWTAFWYVTVTVLPLVLFEIGRFHSLGLLATLFNVFIVIVIVAVIALILSYVIRKSGAKWAGVFLGTLLVLDLGRADLPWIVFWNYPEKYAANPIIDVLRDEPYEHRVADLRSDSLFENLYRIEWSQQLFPYYNIQSLDIIQMSRMPEDLAAYEEAFAKMGTPGLARQWELTDTRYLLGPAAYLDSLNQQLDPTQRRFRIFQRFNVVPKPGIENPTQLSELTAVPADNGDYALFKFTGALPRAKLYSQWQVITNDSVVLQTLTSSDFDAWKAVLVSTPLPTVATANATNESPGAVEFKSYAPTDIWFSVRADAPSVLLLNDKFDHAWRVFVDGKAAPLLRCNFIMRGVYVPPGAHAVQFKFSAPPGPLYVTLSAMGVGILLCGFLFFSTRRTRAV